MLLDQAVAAWRRAITLQSYVESVAQEDKIDHVYGYRIALDIAVAPLFAGIITGDVRPETYEQVYLDCLNIAQANAVRGNLMAREENVAGLAVCGLRLRV